LSFHLDTDFGIGGTFGQAGGDQAQFTDPVTGRPMQVIPTGTATAVRQARTGGGAGFVGGVGRVLYRFVVCL